MRALVIEDDSKLGRLLQRGLSEAGFSVDLAEDGESGLYHAETEPYDAIVLDLMIPRLSGREVLARLRRGGRRTPVLILTARDELADKVASLDQGADDYLTKPFAIAELCARLRALIRRDHRVTSSRLTIADLDLDLSARTVRRGGRAIALSVKQFALLELLALQHGRVVSRTEIYEKIYDAASDTLSNVVDVHVCRLRELIDRGFDRRLIHTVRGHGYRLDAGGDGT